MKVKELIEQLQQLDQEKPIWVLYDGVVKIVPDIEVVEEDDDIVDLKEGDYCIRAY